MAMELILLFIAFSKFSKFLIHLKINIIKNIKTKFEENFMMNSGTYHKKTE